MHKIIFLAGIIGATAVPPMAAAAGGPTGACALITQAELDPFQLRIDGEPSEEGMHVPNGHDGAPSDIQSSICTILLGKKGAQFMSVAIHNFATPVTMAQLDAWEDGAPPDKDNPYTGISKSRVGNVTCEVGQYDYKPSKAPEQAVVQYYEVCDELLGGQQRLVINLQVPSDKSLLPPLEKFRELLDIAVKRMAPRLEASPAKAAIRQPMPAT